MDVDVVKGYIKQSLNEEWRNQFQDHKIISTEFCRAPIGGSLALHLLKLMRNLCVRNQRIQDFWRCEGTLATALSTAGSGDRDYLKILATFIANVVGDNDDNRLLLKEYYPWSFVRWADVDINATFCILQNMGDHAEELLRSDPTMLFVFLGLTTRASQTAGSDFVNIFFSKRGHQFFEYCIQIVEDMDIQKLRGLADAPESFYEILQNLPSQEDILTFLWCFGNEILEEFPHFPSEDTVVRIFNQYMDKVPEATMTGPIEVKNETAGGATSSTFEPTSAPSWWYDFTRLVITRSGDFTEQRFDRWTGDKLKYSILTRVLDFLQAIVTIRLQDPGKYVTIATNWEVVGLLRIVANTLLLKDTGTIIQPRIWILLNHTFQALELPMLQEVGVYCVKLATEADVENQKVVRDLVKVDNGENYKIPDSVRAGLDSDGRLRPISEDEMGG